MLTVHALPILPLHPAAQVAALHQLGPDYQSPLVATESSGLLDQHPAAATTLALGATATAAAAAAAAAASSGDGDAAAAAAAAAAATAAQQGQPPKLLLAFSPQLAAAETEGGGGACSSRGRGGNRSIRDAVLGAPSALLPGTQLCRTQQPHDCLHCLGGVAVLLPLLRLHEQPPAAGDGKASSGASRTSAAGVLRLFAAMLRGSPSNQQDMARIGGFALVAHLLEAQAQRQGSGRHWHLTGELLAAQQQLLAAVTESAELSEGVLR